MSSITKKLTRFIKNPSIAIMALAYRGHLGWTSDKWFLKHAYKASFGKKPNLKSPQTYNEKLQWLKLYDRNPEHIKLVDKYEVKEIVANIIGKEHIIPTLGVYDSFEEIDFDKLPNQFVLKCTHDSGGIVICTDKSTLDIEKARQKLSQALKKTYYSQNREWPYLGVKPRIIAEQYMSDNSGDLPDYKFFCFNGEPKAMFIATDRNSDKTETKFDFYDLDFNHLPFTNGHPNSDKNLTKPACFEEMIGLAKKLSKGIPHVRVDFYQINGKIYFGELTFYHWSGFTPFVPEQWDYTFGSWLDLSTVIR